MITKSFSHVRTFQLPKGAFCFGSIKENVGPNVGQFFQVPFESTPSMLLTATPHGVADWPNQFGIPTWVMVDGSGGSLNTDNTAATEITTTTPRPVLKIVTRLTDVFTQNFNFDTNFWSNI